MRIAVIGRTEMLLSAARSLVADGHQVVWVATAKASPEAEAREDDFERFAHSVGAEYLFSSRLGVDAAEMIRKAKPDVGITMNWPTMIDSNITGAFPLGLINAHGSDLPKYRGNACPNWAILMNEPKIGLTFHMIDPAGLDTGDIVLKKFITNNDQLYIEHVYDWLREAIPSGFKEVIATVARKDFRPIPQDAEGVVRAYPRRPSDGRLDFSMDASHLQRLVRASSRPFSGAYCEYDDGRRVTVWRADIVEMPHVILAVPGQILSFEGNFPLVACGSGVLRFVEFETSDSGPLPRSVRARFY